eukprot:scaffold11106_cov73-Isochrysis_galbana.AAC.1
MIPPGGRRASANVALASTLPPVPHLTANAPGSADPAQASTIPPSGWGSSSRRPRDPSALGLLGRPGGAEAVVAYLHTNPHQLLQPSEADLLGRMVRRDGKGRTRGYRQGGRRQLVAGCRRFDAGWIPLGEGRLVGSCQRMMPTD